MAKQFTGLNKTYAAHINDFNVLVNKVGDLANLNTTVDSDLVGAINAVLTEGGVDSAAIVSILDSGQYLAFPTLTANADSDFVLVFGAQTINGAKRFGGTSEFLNTVTLRNTAPLLNMIDTDRRDSSQNFRVLHGNGGTFFQWADSVGNNASNLLVIRNETGDSFADSSFVANWDFYTGDGTLVARIDSAGELNGLTLMTRTKADARYLLDSNTITAANIQTGAVGASEIEDSSITEVELAHQSVETQQIAVGAVISNRIAADAVDRTKLANEVELQILDSTGAVLKTLYGAGS